MSPYKQGTKVYTRKITIEGRSRWVRAKTKKDLDEKAKKVKAELQAEVERDKALSQRMTVDQLVEEWMTWRAKYKKWGDKHKKNVESTIYQWIVCDPDLGAADIQAQRREKHIRTSKSTYGPGSANHDGYPEKIGMPRRRRHIDADLEAERKMRLATADPRPTLRGLYVDEVTAGHLDDIVTGLTAGGYSYSSVKKVRDIIKQIFRYAFRKKYCTTDPSNGLELPGELPKGKHRAITDIERSVTLDVAKTHRGGIFILIMLYCGLRPQEVARLKWSCVDLENKMITVEAALKNYDEEGSPKTDAGFRIVPIPDYLLEQLKAIEKKSGYVWTASDGSPASTTNISRMWASFKLAMHKKVKANIFKGVVIESLIGDDLALYDYRHTYATDLEAAGVPLGVAMELLGHSQVSVTADIYTHQSVTPTYEALKKLNDFYKK